MADIRGSEQDGQKDAHEFWNNFLELQRAKIPNLDQVYAELALEEVQKLTSPGAREDFTELFNDGCNSRILALIIALFRYSPRLEAFWTSLVGSAENRRRTTRTLENASAALEELFGTLKEIGDAELNTKFARLGEFPPGVSFLNFGSTFDSSTRPNRPPPTRKTAHLRSS